MSPSINNGIEALSFTNHAATDMSQHSAEGTGAVDNVAIIGAGLAVRNTAGFPMGMF